VVQKLLIVFINDLAFLLKDLMTKLFADDTTLIDTHDNMDILITTGNIDQLV
jgi:hypothetical protein